MKSTFRIALFVLAALLSSYRTQAQTAELQVIHNCADPIADSVDVYVDGGLALDNFAFREATGFLTLPSGVDIQVGIAPKTSASAADTLVNFTFNLASGQRYVAIASGVLNPASFASNPDGRATGFTLLVRDNIRNASSGSGDVDFVVLHGATDAPAVDVIPQSSVNALVSGAAYTDITSYLTVPAAAYRLNITPAGDNSTIVASYNVDLSGLGGGAAVVFASGFLDPSANQNGEAFGLFAALPNGTVVEFLPNTNARVQVIHNAADPAAAVVDVYGNSDPLIPDFAFRTATPFIDVPAGVDITIGIAPGTSTSVSDTIPGLSTTVNLTAGQTYVVIANGVTAPGSFSANPDARPINFGLFLKSGARESGGSGANTDFFVLHGATDAPTVDVIPQSSATPLVDNAAYGDITGYVSIPAASYVLNVTPGNDNSAIVASYTADLSTLGGGSAVVFASGFLDPSANQNGEAFGVYAALADGTVLPFALNTNARVQVIHNAADPAAAVVDVYGNSNPLIPDFAFRTATPFINVPAGVDITIGIAPGNSSSVNDTIPGLSTTVNLTAGQTYVVIANGVTAPGSFAANPDARPINFGLFLKTTARETGTDGSNVDFFVLHGATDAPTVDVIPQSSATPLVDNAAYGDITGYVSIPAASYVLNVTPGSDNSTIVASYTADLTTLGGGSAVVFASGFLDPSANQNGEAFGVYAALADGTVIPFAPNTNARVQVIHNSADPAAAVVDVYGNSNPLIPDFAFRTATPFINVPAGVDITIGIAPGNSSSVNDTIPGLSTTVNLTAGQSYVVIANGVTAPASFAANPDGRNTGFALYVKPAVREAGTDGANVDFFAFHGASDAPTVDVIARGVATLVNDAAYGDFTGYLSVPASLYTLDVTPAAGSPIVASFGADLSTLGGGAAVVFASGFLDPTANQNGEAFGLFAALPNGTVVPFTNTTGIEESNISFATGIFPNPAYNRIQVGLRVKNAANAQVQVTDLTGRLVMTRQAYLVDNQLLSLDIEQLPNGFYNLTVVEGSSLQSAPFVVAR